MVKRLFELPKRADGFLDDFLALIPAQYREHPLIKEKYLRDDQRHLRLCELWDRDTVAALWIEAYWNAVSLPFDLWELACEIELRANRNSKTRASMGETAKQPES
jgi:hypothetical protein